MAESASETGGDRPRPRLSRRREWLREGETGETGGHGTDAAPEGGRDTDPPGADGPDGAGDPGRDGGE